MEELLTSFIATAQTLIQNQLMQIQNQSAQICSIETQVDQIVEAINTSPQDMLPRTTDEKKQCNAIIH